MEIPDVLVYAAGLAVIGAAGAWLFMKRKQAKAPGERIDSMLAKVAEASGGSIEEGALVLSRNGLRMRYEFKVTVGEEGSNVHQNVSTELETELPKYFIVRPPSPKALTAIYPKTDSSSYIANKIRNAIESDAGAIHLMKNGYCISLSTGGICISPQMGLFMGKKNLVMLDIESELSKSSIFYDMLSDRFEESREMQYVEEWKEIAINGFALLEKIAESAKVEN